MKDPSVSKLTLQEQLNNKGDFARLLNIIPADSVRFSMDASRFLWDELKNVLNASIFAESALTESENELLDQAIDFLTDEPEVSEDEFKIPVYSVAVLKYYEYKTIYEEAERTYLGEKITVESTSGQEGQELKRQWDSYREKQLRGIKDKAEQDWRHLGFKKQVEYYQSVEKMLEPKKYLNLYKKNYMDEINLSEIFDLNGLGIGIHSTFFSPFDAFDPNLPWAKLTLTKEEINTLVKKAPPELKSIFDARQGSDDIESISLEYNNVVIIRSWFKLGFFESKFWNLPDNTVVSDGNVPRTGKIPAYITSMIVARNVSVTRKKAVEKKEMILPIVSSVPLEKVKIASQPKEVKLAEVKASQPPNRIKVMGIKLQVPDVNGIQTEQTEQKKRYVAIKYNGTTIKTPHKAVEEPSGNPPRTTPEAELVTETYNLDGVVVLAFVCRRVAKSPNPDNRFFPIRITLNDGNSYDFFSERTSGMYSGGDFYLSGLKFLANNVGQRGVKGLGDISTIPLGQVDIPKSGYTRFGVPAVVGHTYVSLAQEGEEGGYIVFRVHSISGESVTIDFAYLKES
jgi:hypothetical protein